MLPTTIELQPVDEGTIAARRDAVLNAARAIEIDCPEMLDVANDELGAIKRAKAEWEARLKSITAPLRQAEAAAREVFRPVIDAHANAEAIVKLAIGKWMDRQRQIAMENRRKLEEVVRIEQERAAEEARLKAEEAARLEAQARAASIDDQPEILARAAEAKAQAFEIAATPVVMAPAPAVEKVKGLSVRVKWTAECFDPAALMRFVVEHPEYACVFKVDQSALNKFASAQQDLFRLPGCRAVPDQIIGKRAA